MLKLFIATSLGTAGSPLKTEGTSMMWLELCDHSTQTYYEQFSLCMMRLAAKALVASRRGASRIEERMMGRWVG